MLSNVHRPSRYSSPIKSAPRGAHKRGGLVTSHTHQPRLVSFWLKIVASAAIVLHVMTFTPTVNAQAKGEHWVSTWATAVVDLPLATPGQGGGQGGGQAGRGGQGGQAAQGAQGGQGGQGGAPQAPRVTG